MITFLFLQWEIDDPLYPSSLKDCPGGQQEQGHGVVLHDPGEGYQKPPTFRSWNSQVVFGVLMRCPNLRFPIRIFLFDELELIIFVS